MIQSQICPPTDQILLPQNKEEFDSLVTALCTGYQFTDRNHVGVVLAYQIQKLPNDNPYSTIEYLAGCIQKSIAYSVALQETRVLSQKAQIDHIAAILKSNPHDQQALDALETASKEGSAYAREILSLYRPVDAGDNVVKMNPMLDENKGPVLQETGEPLV